MSKKVEVNALCGGCVYYPPNLPQQYYAPEDWRVLQQLACAYDCSSGSEACENTRKSHCDLVDMTAVINDRGR